MSTPELSLEEWKQEMDVRKPLGMYLQVPWIPGSTREQMSKLNLSAGTEPAFIISADDQFESGVDFTLTQISQ